MSQKPLTAYTDCFSGISGDMFLGALVDCGLPEAVLKEEIGRLNISGFEITVNRKQACGISSIHLQVNGTPQQHYRHLSSIIAILENSDLGSHVISRCVDVFQEIARAEAKVHDIPIEKVHFHEVGAVDTLIDVVGTIAGLSYLGVDRLYSSPLPNPRGFVKCAHGRLPLPAPAVCEILSGVPCYGVDQTVELVTPTGAALLKVLSLGFGPMPPMSISSTGYGAGSHHLADDTPNLFRLILGHPFEAGEHQEVEVIETHLDDWSPEGFPHLCELLFQAGALDVSLTPVQMKKGRPGFAVKIISPLHLSQPLRRILFLETTAIGLRYHRESRQTLPRKIVSVPTQWGSVNAKEIETPMGLRVYPEYEECRKIAKQYGVPLQQVYRAITSGVKEK
ncbi:MAG: nickel pincer cofactor biosynthesis protein LarC [Desulfopila sp.]|nr:nickel pincer cofactor biosynthesis protein LarC [Desulfopila sp.]